MSNSPYRTRNPELLIFELIGAVGLVRKSNRSDYFLVAKGES
jgi:hypothetical protein